MNLQIEEISYKNSRIKILTDKKELIKDAYDELVRQRGAIEEYIVRNRNFEISLEPIGVEKGCADIVKEMAAAGKIAHVGPMAAVAGAIAEAVCRKMISQGAKAAIVENGGDIFAITNEPIKVGLFAGKNKLTGKIAFKLDKNNTPISICSSSSFMGHSYSLGKCDLATVFSKKGAVADAAVTALANRIKSNEDIKAALKWVLSLKGVDGALAIKNDEVGMIGDIPNMIRTDDEKIKEKVTKDESYAL